MAVQETGVNLRNPIQDMFAHPTPVLFCEGKAGMAAAKALIEGTPESGGLNLPLRPPGHTIWCNNTPTVHTPCPLHHVLIVLACWHSIY